MKLPPPGNRPLLRPPPHSLPFAQLHPRLGGGRFGPVMLPGRPAIRTGTAHPGRPNTRSGAAIRAALANPTGQDAAQLSHDLGGPFIQVLAAQSYARLKTLLGDKLTVADGQDPRVQRAVVELGFVPPPVLAALARNQFFAIRIGAQPITSYPEGAGLAGQTPQGWPAGLTWADAGGVFTGAAVLVNVAGTGGESGDTINHEVGHAVQRYLLDGGTPPELQDAWTRDSAKLNSYFQQTGARGVAEFFAQSLQDLTLSGQAFVAQRYDPAYAAWLAGFVGSLTSSA